MAFCSILAAWVTGGSNNGGGGAPGVGEVNCGVRSRHHRRRRRRLVKREPGQNRYGFGELVVDEGIWGVHCADVADAYRQSGARES